LEPLYIMERHLFDMAKRFSTIYYCLSNTFMVSELGYIFSPWLIHLLSVLVFCLTQRCICSLLNLSHLITCYEEINFSSSIKCLIKPIKSLIKFLSLINSSSFGQVGFQPLLFSVKFFSNPSYQNI
jgi:hypothetical protein